ncbi:MAG: hypothetical protein M5U09_06230 [Gammaproteobacteria bacterium]|nr:hypothetical protein [Gammaproteobacteria bacterium]
MQVVVAGALVAVATLAAGSDRHCGERLLLDSVLDIDPQAEPPPGIERGDPLFRLFRIIDGWAMAVAVGDYEGAESLGEAAKPGLVSLLGDVSAIDPADPESIYVRLLVRGTTGPREHGQPRLDRRRALRHRGPSRRRPARHPPPGRRARRLLPRPVRTVHRPGTRVAARRRELAGLDGDVERGRERMESVIRRNDALAPEAARVLLEELPPRHRPACRYLSLAVDLAQHYSRNGRFHWYVEREFDRCSDYNAAQDADPPRLAGHCGRL